jgi:lipoprotein NlpD
MRIEARPFFAAVLSIGALALPVLQGCATSGNHAPVEDRMAPKAAPNAPAVAASGAGSGVAVESVKTLPGIENAGKPGYYTVKPGDTMIRIGLESGQNWKDIVKWNNLDNPNIIEVGQVMRVVAPGGEVVGAVTRPVAGTKVDARPLDAKPAAAAASGAPTAAASGVTILPTAPLPTPTAPSPASAAAPAAAPASASREADDEVSWLWPAAGPVATPFEEGKVKGLVLSGKAGDPVLAAADGRVVYAGSGLRGYGNLVILKHNNTYLTAYAHNQTLLVKEDQVVRRGQKIAEMGSSDADRVQLHFEIRKQGKPIDPAKLLPPR